MKGFFYNLKAKRIKPTHTYDNTLINELNQEHEKLFIIYDKIIETYISKKYRKTLKYLKKFYETYHLHILKEDNQLYNYLKTKYKFFPEIKEQITQKQEEMKKITLKLEEFILKYNNIKTIQENNKFLKELGEIGKALTERVKFEETKLYDKY